MEMLKKCLNPKVLAGLGIIAVALLIFAPQLALSLLPLLLIAACPLSMIVMMRAMGGRHDTGTGSSGELETLKQRFAKGEITEQQYDSMKNKLQGNQNNG